MGEDGPPIPRGPRGRVSARLIDRLSRLLNGAQQSAALVAPFMKAAVVRQLLQKIAPSVDVVCVTRWRAEEVASGVSDLDVFEACRERPKTSMFLRHDLHAKYYRADAICLVGSANVTRKGLGTADAPNLEVLIKVGTNHPDLSAFEQTLLAKSIPATGAIRDHVWEAAKRIGKPPTHSELSAPAYFQHDFAGWLPTCLVPSHLFSVYRGDRSRLADPAFRDALYDLEFLDVPPGLQAPQFRGLIASRLIQHPVFSTLLSSDRRCRDQEDIRRVLVETLDGPPDDEDVQAVWGWLLVFFPSRVGETGIRPGSSESSS